MDTVTTADLTSKAGFVESFHCGLGDAQGAVESTPSSPGVAAVGNRCCQAGTGGSDSHFRATDATALLGRCAGRGGLPLEESPSLPVVAVPTGGAEGGEVPRAVELPHLPGSQSDRVW